MSTMGDCTNLPDTSKALQLAKRSVERAEAEQRHSMRIVRALADVTPVLRAAPSLEALLQTAAQRACLVFDARAAFVGLEPASHSTSSRIDASFGSVDSARDNLDDPSWFTAGGDSLEDREAPQVLSPSSPPHLTIEPPSPLRPWRSTPLRGRDGSRLGILRIIIPPERDFHEIDNTIFAQLAQIIAAAIESVRLSSELQHLNQIREDFTAVVSHDLRSPLGTIQLAMWQIRELSAPGPPHLEKAARCVERSVSSMNRMIENLVELSQVKAGRLTLDLANIPTSSIMDAAFSQARPNAETANVQLIARATTALPNVRVDHHRILQVVSNLVVNTLKFTPAGGDIQLAAEPYQGMVRISVQGKGNPLDPETLSHLFENFWRSKDAKHRALGLGLYIAKHVIKAHGGEIWVEQQPERVCIFHLTLPAAT